MQREKSKEVKSERDDKRFKAENTVQLIDEDGKERSDANSTDEYEDVFCIFAKKVLNTISCLIGGIQVEVVIDSGSKFNMVDLHSWNALKENGIEIVSKIKKTDRNFKAYGGQCLDVIGMFRASISVQNKQMLADFYVVREKGKILLGHDTAIAMKVLKIGYDVNNVEETEKQSGTIKDIVVDIPLNPAIKPVIQPYRRVPVPVQQAVENKIKEMLQTGIIEKVDGPSIWISQLVVVPKGEDIRICVDMRRANQAVARKNYPLPTMDEFLTELQGAKIFSRLDVKNAFHQVWK